MEATAVAGLVVAAVVLTGATALGLWWRRREGRVTSVPGERGSAGELLTGLGVVPGTPVTLLQFSSAFCTPCRATRVLCGRLAADLDGVRHLEVDAESHLDVVRALGVWRTPTVFVVDAAGRLVARVTGQPRREQLLAAVQPLLPREVWS